ncbi:hypothetical protein AMIS_12710 [Actinoplanes missouriensis 431]|uniref:Uncharacterized protein n=1 Tax=Actinoplanes missouriensis (strain ATCC 14538 / DSM 43046 / CBS 188.64 / JCM 3121 / NBRC 102363 / NCIMB 12654 / NRRL B-3342 / UNCC 431) TaxID=512565 RepID=I0H0F4_ACTM4|nr:hypothetical protein [Actinoplanes missouriensis]BAL86491.1 hypothetical protein AMIS_12710 [Actinoplanes missouriensis 431]
MAQWVLVPSLVRLRADLNAIAPGRDRASDGTIGDRAHQASVSDHNDDEVGRVPIRDADRKHEVHAFDADDDLRTPNLTMEMVVQHILRRCRSGAEKRLRYIIYNRRIWEASNSWRQRAYTGASPHTEHAHFSASYETRHEADTSSWRLEDIEVALTDADKKWLSAQIDAAATKAAERVWKTRLNIAVQSGAKPNLQEAGSILRYTPSEHHRIEDEVESLRTEVQKVLAEDV